MEEKKPIKLDKQIELTKEKIRPELNLEKLPIFLPSHSPKKERFKYRIIKRGNSKIGINPHNLYGNLITLDKDVLYSIYQLWEDFGKRPDGFLPISRQKIAEILGMPTTGKTIELLKQSLIRLGSCTFTFEGYFYNNKTKETYEILDLFHILTDLKIITKKKKDKNKPETREERGFCKINPLIVQNILNNYCKPLYFKTYLGLEGEITKLLYSHLDLIMADKTKYERKTKELFFEDLKLESQRYQLKRIRKQRLEQIINQLRGKPLSTGTISFIDVVKTEDDTDYKLIVIKTPFTKQIKEPPIKQSEPQSQDLINQAKELVNYFHKKFDRPNQEPKDKEINQAISLINKYNNNKEDVKYLIDYAINKAYETNFQMQNFGAILYYEPEASKSLQAKKNREKREAEERKKEEIKKEEERKQREILMNYYHSLPLEEKERIDQQTMDDLKLIPLIKEQIQKMQNQNQNPLDSYLIRNCFEFQRFKILENKINNNNKQQL